MSGDWTIEDMRILGGLHADLEARRDLEGTLATLVEEPAYEFWPVGLRMTGRTDVARYYEHLFASFIPATRHYALISEWVNEESLAQEYEIHLEFSGRLERHRLVGVLFAEGSLLGGERIHASEACLRRMLGDLIDELTPISFEG